MSSRNKPEEPKKKDRGLYGIDWDNDGNVDLVDDLISEEDGGVYCLPQEVKPKIWYYRNDVFAEIYLAWRRSDLSPAQRRLRDFILKTVTDQAGGKRPRR